MSDITVHIEFRDGKTPWDEKINMNYPTGRERDACVQVLAGINATNGVMRFLDDETGVEFVPLTEVKSLKITAPVIALANSGDLEAVRKHAEEAAAVQRAIKLA